MACTFVPYHLCKDDRCHGLEPWKLEPNEMSRTQPNLIGPRRGKHTRKNMNPADPYI